MLASAMLAGCGGTDPIERARITAGRPPVAPLPPVPGEAAPYPNLGSVPQRPATMTPEARQALANQLVADRANARYVGQPVVPAVARAAPAPTQAEAPPMVAPESPLLGAIEERAQPLGSPVPPPIAGAPAEAAAQPAREDRLPIQAAPAPIARIAADPLPPPPPAMPAELPPRARAAAEPPPASPAARALERDAGAMAAAAAGAAAGQGAQQARLDPQTPPVPPAAPVLLPAVAQPRPEPSQAPQAQIQLPAPVQPPPAQPVAAAEPPRPAPAAPPPVVPSVVVDRTALAPAQSRPDGTGYALAFLPGTTTLAATDEAVVARLAARGPGVTYRVTGFGDAASPGRELDLPLARARAVANALRAAGAPAEAIELGGEARPGPAGRGAEIRLVYRR